MSVKNLADQLVNHGAFVVDSSGSTRDLSSAIDQSIRQQVDFLADTSTVQNQETRGTLYLFDDDIECLYYDMDVLRLREKLTQKKKIHKVGGMTRLVGSTLQAILDLEKSATLYGDHAFLIYTWTDGLENASTDKERHDFREKVRRLPNNWTLVALVPDEKGKREAVNYGFLENNVALWDTTVEGLATAQTVVQQATEQFFVARSHGFRGTRNFFQLDLSNVTTEKVQKELISLPIDKFKIYPVTTREEISDFVKARVGTYKRGMGFYHLTDDEEVQPGKQVILRDKQTRAYYTGPGARQLVGLPDHKVTLRPKQHPQWDVFIESWSHNRKTDVGTDLLVFP